MITDCSKPNSMPLNLIEPTVKGTSCVLWKSGSGCCTHKKKKEKKEQAMDAENNWNTIPLFLLNNWKAYNFMVRWKTSLRLREGKDFISSKEATLIYLQFLLLLHWGGSFLGGSILARFLPSLRRVTLLTSFWSLMPSFSWRTFIFEKANTPSKSEHMQHCQPNSFKGYGPACEWFV